jgi:hypothetical protein
VRWTVPRVGCSRRTPYPELVDVVFDVLFDDKLGAGTGTLFTFDAADLERVVAWGPVWRIVGVVGEPPLRRRKGSASSPLPRGEPSPAERPCIPTKK